MKPEGWHLTGIFLATIVGSILEPVPAAAIVLMAIAVTPILTKVELARALSGYSDAVVWLVIAAFFISRALINTGLARRIALLFVRLVGTSSLGVSYALALSDMVLAMMIPSNGARCGGVTLPIVRSIAELYDSRPGETAGRLGSYLMTSVYQSICVTTAMFFTGQASNALAASIASKQFGVPITWSSWFLAGIVPGLCSLAAVSWVVLRLNPPEIKETPEAAQFAADKLREMGPLSPKEKILAAVFVGVCSLWITGWVDVTTTALGGVFVLLLTGVITWEDCKSEKAAWDMFVWYGGLVQLGRLLSDFGVTRAFAENVVGTFASSGWIALFGITLLIYFYAHYGFASITAHLLAMFPPFMALLLAKGAPAGLTAYAFICFTNLSAGLTNYGTTPTPMFYAQGYVSLGKWWRIGLIVSFVNILIWSVVGFTWWKILRIW